MSTFKTLQVIQLSPEAAARATAFAKAVITTVNYGDSSQTVRQKYRMIILDIPNAWICLVVYEDLKPGYECVVYPLRKINQLMFEAARLNKLVGKKQAVYLETLQKHKIF